MKTILPAIIAAAVTTAITHYFLFVYFTPEARVPVEDEIYACEQAGGHLSVYYSNMYDMNEYTVTCEQPENELYKKRFNP